MRCLAFATICLLMALAGCSKSESFVQAAQNTGEVKVMPQADGTYLVQIKRIAFGELGNTGNIETRQQVALTAMKSTCALTNQAPRILGETVVDRGGSLISGTNLLYGDQGEMRLISHKQAPGSILPNRKN